MKGAGQDYGSPDFDFDTAPDSQAIRLPPRAVRVAISSDRPWVSDRLAELLRNVGSIEVLNCEETTSAVSAGHSGRPADVLLLDCAVGSPGTELEFAL